MYRSLRNDTTVTPLAIGYVMIPQLGMAHAAVAREIEGLRQSRHRIIQIMPSLADTCPYAGGCTLDEEWVLASEVSTACAVIRGIAHPARVAAAAAFAKTQTGLPMRTLLRSAMQVALIAKQHGCMHIHAPFADVSAAVAITAACLAGLTCSFMGQGDVIDGHGTESNRATNELAAKLAAADIAFAPNNDMAEAFRRIVPSANTWMVPRGIDLEYFVPTENPVNNGRLLAIGRLEPQKGYAVLLEALSMFPVAQRPMIDIVGTGPLEAALKRRSEALGVAAHVRFLGAWSSERIISEAPHYQAFLAPYLDCEEADRGANIATVEAALAIGLPIVGSALADLKDIIHSSCGRQVVPGDATGLAEAIAWIAALPAMRRQMMSSACRRHARANFSLAGQLAGLAAVISAIQEHADRPLRRTTRIASVPRT